MQYITTGSPATNVWRVFNGQMGKTNKWFPKGTIIAGKPVSFSLGGHKMDFISVSGGYVYPKDVVVYKPNSSHSNADGDVTPVVVPPIMKALPSIVGSVGFIWGLGYSFKHKKGFWAYVGYSFLGSVAGTAVGGLVTVISYPSTLDNIRNKK